MKVDILAIGAHPDDVELGCSATLAKEIASGKSVAIVDLTQGELGTRGSAEIRLKEARAAADILGVKERVNLKFRDAFFKNDEEHQLELIKQIRRFKPDIVLCNAVDDRHIDHPKGSSLASDACFLSGLRRISTTWDNKEQEAWRPRLVLHYMQWKDLEPDILIDVSGYLNQKLEAVKAYKSQFYDPDSKEPESPISSKNFLDSVVYRAKNLGRILQVDAAEGFNSERYIGTQKLDDII